MSPRSNKPVSHKHYPRGSSFYANSNCDVSFQLSQASGEEPPTPFSDRGSDVHAVIYGKETDDDGIREEAQVLLSVRDQLVNDWSDGSPTTVFREKRLWLTKGMKPFYSGQPDEFIVQGRRVLLNEYKTSWHPLDDWVATNSQIRAYVPLIDAELKGQIDEITATLIKPGKQVPPAIFDREAIDDAHEWAVAVAATSMSKAEKVPKRGPWCKYCSGKVLCPLWRDEMLSLSELSSAIAGDVPDSMLRAIAPKLHLAREVADKLLARLYERVRAKPDFFADWHFAPAVSRRKIDDVIEAFNALVVRNKVLTTAEFLVSSRLAVNDLELNIRKNQGITAQQARRLLEQLLAGVMQHNKGRDTLVYAPRDEQLEE